MSDATGTAPNSADDDYGEFPLKGLLGLSIDDEGDEAVACIEIGHTHLNPNGVAHGAVLFAMVDTAMGKATMKVIPEGCYCATIEIQLRFLRPVGPGPCEARVRVIKPGRSIVHLSADVTDSAGKLSATATGSFAVLAP